MPHPQPNSPADLDVAVETLGKALDLAANDARQCTGFDAPAMRGMTFWSRANRYLAEELTPHKWRYTPRDSILRCVHPEGTHALTAMSAAGGVGDPRAEVRTRNPKGRAVASVVETNGQLAFYTPDHLLFGRELNDIPTWFLLYQREAGPNGIRAELSLPVDMDGPYVNRWLVRLPLDLPGIGDPGDLGAIDSDPVGGDAPQTRQEDNGLDVMVEYRKG